MRAIAEWRSSHPGAESCPHNERPHYSKGRCRSCYYADYYAAHPEKQRQRHAAYHATHREQVRERKAAYRAANREQRSRYNAAYYAAHREQVLQRQAAYNAAHRQKQRQRKAAYYAAHPELWREAVSRRRERRAGYVVAVEHRDTQAPCGVCGGFIDHTLKFPNPMSAELGHEPPLSRASEGVLRYEHKVCNLIKGNLTDAELLGRPDLLARLPGWDKGLAA